MVKITIIGGYGGMGQFFAKLFIRLGHSVIVTGRDPKKGEKAEKELGVKYMRDNKKAAQEADVVIVTVPIDYTINTIEEIGPYIKDGSVFMDFTSIKEEPCRAMLESTSPGVDVIGTHPMFGPRVESLDGQVVVLAPMRLNSSFWFEWIRNILVPENARVIESQPEHHDKVMAVVQGLTHFTYIAIAKTLMDMDFDIKDSRKFASPIYGLMLDMIGRIVGQDPNLYASIQMENPRIPQIHDSFLYAAGEISKMVKNKEHDDFVKMMAQSARHYDDVDAAMGRSDKAIYALMADIESLKNSLGSEVAVKHIYSGNIHTGILKEITPDIIVLEQRTRAGSVTRVSLKISNIRIIERDERISYEISHSGVIKRDFTYVIDENMDENFICDILKLINENIISADVRDVYRGDAIPEGKKSVCFGVNFLNNLHGGKAYTRKMEKVVEEFFKRIGCVKR